MPDECIETWSNMFVYIILSFISHTQNVAHIVQTSINAQVKTTKTNY